MQRKTFFIGTALAILLFLSAQHFWAKTSSTPTLTDVAKDNVSKFLTPFSVTDEASASVKPRQSNAERPESISEEDWSMLVQSLSLTGQTAKDASSLIDHLAFERTLGEVLVIDGQTSPGLLRQKATQLLADLPNRVAKNDLTLSEAAFFGNFLYTEIEDDESKRVASLTDLQAKLAHSASQSSNDQSITDQNRIVERRRKQASAFSEWSERTDPLLRTQANLDLLMVHAVNP